MHSGVPIGLMHDGHHERLGHYRDRLERVAGKLVSLGQRPWEGIHVPLRTWATLPLDGDSGRRAKCLWGRAGAGADLDAVPASRLCLTRDSVGLPP